MFNKAPVAQLDRVIGYEPIGREFESLRARHYRKSLIPCSSVGRAGDC